MGAVFGQPPMFDGGLKELVLSKSNQLAPFFIYFILDFKSNHLSEEHDPEVFHVSVNVFNSSCG